MRALQVLLARMEESGAYTKHNGDPSRVARDVEDLLNHPIQGRSGLVPFLSSMSSTRPLRQAHAAYQPSQLVVGLTGMIKIDRIHPHDQHSNGSHEIGKSFGDTYNSDIPLYIVLPPEYPRSPPICFVQPVTDLYFVGDHPNAHHDGRVDMDYLQKWQNNKDNTASITGYNLIDMVISLISIFEANPPCYKTRGGTKTGPVLPCNRPLQQLPHPKWHHQQQTETKRKPAPEQNGAELIENTEASKIKNKNIYSDEARNFVKSVIQLHKEIQEDFLSNIHQSHDQGSAIGLNLTLEERKKMRFEWLVAGQVCTLAKETMACMTEQVLQHQRFFLSEGGDGGEANGTAQPTSSKMMVDIGYHYTNLSNITQIHTYGLLTRSERSHFSISSKYNGSTYGEGVYTSDDPLSYTRLGDTGLLVARLSGTTTTDKNNITAHSFVHPGARSMKVHRLSSLCIPLVQYPTELISTGTPIASSGETSEVSLLGKDVVFKYHQRLQALIDGVFNGGKETLVLRPQNPARPLRQKRPLQHTRPLQRARLMRQEMLSSNRMNVEVLTYTAPATLSAGFDATVFLEDCAVDSRPLEETCVICLTSLSISVDQGDTIVSLKNCQHWFHRICILTCLDNSVAKKCPCCNQSLHDECEPQGRMPSGTMHVKYVSDLCNEQYNRQDCIEIQYVIPSGVQLAYHENPGQRHDGTTRNAYIPNSPEGRALLHRLKYAFKHGLVFTVGTSLTSGRHNQVTWASIHHKTTRFGGLSDPSFLVNCNGELDALDVPCAPALS